MYDGHGSTRALFDPSLLLTLTGVYAQNASGTNQLFACDAYGNMLSLPDYATSVSEALTSLLYSGEQTDRTGLQYFHTHCSAPATTGRRPAIMCAPRNVERIHSRFL